MKVLRLMVLLSVCVMPCAFAQVGTEAGTVPPAGENSRDVGGFYTTGWSPIQEDLYYVAGVASGKPVYAKAALYEMSRSLLCKLPAGAQEFVFYRKSAVPPKPGETESYEVAARAPVPDAKKRYTLIFMPKKDGKYPLTVVSEDPADTPLGSYRIYNYTKVACGGMLNGEKFQAEPGTQTLVGAKAATNAEMEFQLFVKEKEGFVRVMRNKWFYNPMKFTACFLYADVNSAGNLVYEIKRLITFRAPAPKS